MTACIAWRWMHIASQAGRFRVYKNLTFDLVFVDPRLILRHHDFLHQFNQLVQVQVVVVIRVHLDTERHGEW